MSNDPQGGPDNIATPSSDNPLVQTANCPICQHSITFTLPMGTPFRHPQGTIVFFPHPNPICCPECRQFYTPIFLGAQGVTWNWQPCPPPAEQSRIIQVNPPQGPIPFKRRN